MSSPVVSASASATTGAWPAPSFVPTAPRPVTEPIDDETDTDTDAEMEGSDAAAAPAVAPLSAWWGRDDWFKALALDAILKSNVDALGRMLQAGLDPNENVILGTERGTLLSHAVMNNVQPAVLKLLLQYGADPSAPGPEGILPLHVAAATGDVDVAELLLDYGADPDAPMQGSRITPSAMALSNERFVLVDMLMRARDRPPELRKRPDRTASVPPTPRARSAGGPPKLKISLSLDSGQRVAKSPSEPIPTGPIRY